MRFYLSLLILFLSVISSYGEEFLLHGLSSRKGTRLYSWRLSGAKREVVSGKNGNALRVYADSDIPGGKADMPVIRDLPPEVEELSVWVYAPENPEKRPKKVGWQTTDSEGERLMYLEPVDWAGWKKISINLKNTPWEQAYKQDDKSGRADFPLKDMNLIWFASRKGPQELIFDDLVGRISQKGNTDWSLFPIDNLSMSRVYALGETPNLSYTVNNPSSESLKGKIEYKIYSISSLNVPQAPDLKWGNDIALGASSKSYLDGELVAADTLTDDDRGTNCHKMPNKKKHPDGLKEMEQLIDLGCEVVPKKIEISNSDANWAYMLDIYGSKDNKNFRKISGWSGIKLFHKWRPVEMLTDNNEKYRYIKLKYHTNGLGSGKHGPGGVVDGGGSNHFKLPWSVKIYDGLNDENTALLGNEDIIFEGSVSYEIAPSTYKTVGLDFPAEKLNHQGAYAFGIKNIRDGKTLALSYSEFFIWKPIKLKPGRETRFGVNASRMDQGSENRRMGFSNVRYENMKWYMVSDKQDIYNYTDGVKPWCVKQDAIIENYAKLGLRPLVMMLGAPKYASSKPNAKRPFFYPPDSELYKEWAFQTAARYGSRKHAPEKLKTKDKKSGLNWIKYYEIWNEPDLNHPKWGALIGEFRDFYPILRAGYEGVKKADPDALVVNGGLAGVGLKHWQDMAEWAYSDGKHPVDFLDILNFHYYSGKRRPEEGGVNTNINRSGEGKKEKSFADQIKALAAWRDENKPDAPIWLTETGWDTEGGKFVSEREQAAYLVRGSIIALAAGVDRIYIYREKDSGKSLYTSCGFRRENGSYKPSTFTYSYMMKRVKGLACIGRVPFANNNIYAFLFADDKKNLLIAWDASSAEKGAILKISSVPKSVNDSFGGKIKLSKDIELSAFPVYIELSPKAFSEFRKTAEAFKKAEKEALERAKNKKVLLIDFGGIEKIATLNIGKPRAAEVADYGSKWNGRTFGFVKGAMRNQYRKWDNNPMNCDDVVCSRNGAEFKVKLQPGKYKMNIGLNPFSSGPFNFKIKAGEKVFVDKELKLKPRNVNDIERIIEISPSNTVLSISTEGNYVHWHYLTFIEE